MYAQKSITSKDFTNNFENYLKTSNKTQFLTQLKWDKWIYSSGEFPV